MSNRKIQFVNGEHYHIFNRGVDKRVVYIGEDDIERFFQSMNEFNVIDPIGSIYASSFNKKTEKSQLRSRTPKLALKSDKLVNFICFHLLPNHYHFILEQLADNGISKFMQKLGTGYTNYFNEKYNRSGSLFQGAYKAIHINSNEYLLHINAYVNLNDRVHQLRSRTPKWQMKSSWEEYINEDQKDNFCQKDIILGQFDDADDYKRSAEESLEGILERRAEMKNLLLE